jgi:hypothetical protein
MVSDGVGGYHGRAELGLLRGRDQGDVSVCGLRMGPRAHAPYLFMIVPLAAYLKLLPPSLILLSIMIILISRFVIRNVRQ